LNPVSDWQKLQGVLLETTAPSRKGWDLLQADFKRENLLGTCQSGKELHWDIFDVKEGKIVQQTVLENNSAQTRLVLKKIPKRFVKRSSPKATRMIIITSYV
jgi:hypothetical protein